MHHKEYNKDMYTHIIKPILFLFSPDFVHRTIVMTGRAAQAIPVVRWGMRRVWRFEDVSLRQRIDGVDFQNPIGLAAGFDKNVQLSPLMESVGFGFASGGSVTLESRSGNPRPWFRRLPRTKSVVVHAGMPNHGLARIRHYIARNQRRIRQMPVVVSVAVIANTTTRQRLKGLVTEEAIIQDVQDAVRYIVKYHLADIIEINISCPNAGREPFIHPEPLERLLKALDAMKCQVPLWLKMPHLYDMEQFDALARTAIRHNVQGLTVANLVKDRTKVTLKDSLADCVPGGLSGMPTRIHSLELIRRAYRLCGDRVTIIGVGGVFSAEDAYQKIKAGASLVGLITGLFFEGPQVVGRINRQLSALLQADGFSSVTEAIGADVRRSEKKPKNL